MKNCNECIFGIHRGFDKSGMPTMQQCHSRDMSDEESENMNIKDFKVGQTVFVELINNTVRGKEPEQCIEEWEVLSTGRKYIRAVCLKNIHKKRNFEYRENYNGFVDKTNYSPEYVLYSTKKEIEDKHEKSRLWHEISDTFKCWGLRQRFSLDQLRRIKAIIDEEK